METINAIGRRKASIARIYINEGKGKFTINNRDIKEYFPLEQLQYICYQPLEVTGNKEKYDIKVILNGGGYNGQAQALRLAVARGLTKIDPENKTILRANGLLTRDPRRVERKKPGQPKARKRFQFSKR